MISIYAEKIEEVWFGVATDEQLIFGTSFYFNQQDTLRSLLCSLPFNVPFQTISTPTPFAANILETVRRIYDGKDSSENFSLATEHLSRFNQEVLYATSLVPVGFVTSYGALAKAVGGSPRAVGHVMATNPYPPIVPCHRVVSYDFSLGGYGGGLEVKLEFLAREKRGYKSQREIQINDKALKIYPVESVFEKIGPKH